MIAQAARRLLAVLMSIVLVVGLMPLPSMAQRAAAAEGDANPEQVVTDPPASPDEKPEGEGESDNAPEFESTPVVGMQAAAKTGQGDSNMQDLGTAIEPASTTASEDGQEGNGEDDKGKGGEEGKDKESPDAGNMQPEATYGPVTVDGVDYYYDNQTGQGADTVAITSIVTGNSTVNIPSTLSIESGLGTVTATVVALKGDDYATDITGKIDTLTIPASVTSMAPLSTSPGNSIGSVVFAAGSALDIPEGAFNGVYGLTSVTLPSGSIGARAFEGRDELSNVTWTSGTSVGEDAFSGCTALASITLPNDLTTIGAEAFKNTGLTAIAIPDSVTDIGASAFEGATLADGVTLGSGVQTIGADAFKNAQFTSIAMPSSLISYYTNPSEGTAGTTAFSGCNNLTTITWPESGSLTVVGGFWDCPNLAPDTLQNLPTWITEIDYEGFSPDNGNVLWENVVIPGHITTIGDRAFAGRGMKSVSIPASVTYIGSQAFQSASMSNLTSLTIAEEGGPLRIEEEAFNGSLNYTDGAGEIVLPARVSYIGKDAFAISQNTDFRICNKDIELQKEGGVVADPWGGGLWGTVYYPSDAAADSDIMKIKARYDQEGLGSMFDFEPFEYEPPTKAHSIKGTVPTGATVTVSVAGVDYIPDMTATATGATFTMDNVEEGTLVYAVVSLDGYLDYTVYPAMDDKGNPTSVVMPDRDWTFNVTANDMKPLATTGTLHVMATGDYAKDCHVAVFTTDGKLVAQGKVVRARFFTADSLPAGKYNVAAWQANDYFTRVSSQADFLKMGLVQGTDYAWRTGVEVEVGKEADVSMVVPAMRTDRIAGMLKSGDVWLSNSITPPGVTFNARISYEMAGGNKADYITVSLPEGLDVKQVYTATHAYSTGEYSISGVDRTLRVSLANADKASGRLWLGLQAAPSDTPYTINAQVESGAAKVPLGSANIGSPAIQLMVPEGALSGTTFDVTVFTAPEATVSFAINGQAIATTCKTNKVGRGTATLTIPQDMLSVNPHYSVTATVQIGGREYNAYETVEYSYFGGSVSPNVYEFYFTHSGGTVYLAREGKNLSGGYYFVLAEPTHNPTAYSTKWEFTAVLESAVPLLGTATLRLGMLDGSTQSAQMDLINTEDSINGAKRYTYRCVMNFGKKENNYVLGADEIPYLFDVVPAVEDNVDQIIDTLKPTLVNNFGDLVAETHDQMKKEADQRYQGMPHDVISSIGADTTYEDLDQAWVDWLQTLDSPLREKMASSMGVFGYAYKHEVWDPTGAWFNGLTADEQALVLESEAYYDEAFELLAVALGDKKPMPAYASYEEYLKDNYGFEQGQYDKEQLRAEGYTIIENTDTARAKQAWASYGYSWDGGSAGPLSAPSWIAVKFVDESGSDVLLNAQNQGPSVGQQAKMVVKDANNNGITKTFSHTTGGVVDRAVGATGDVVGIVDGVSTAVDNGFVASSTLGLSARGATGLNVAGKACSFLGPFISCYQTYRATESKKQTVTEYQERKGELDRVNQQIEFYSQHRGPDGKMTKCEEALRQEKVYLEKLVKQLYWSDWISFADVGMNALYGVGGSTAAILVATGVGAPEGAIVGISTGVSALCWSGASAAANALLAPQADIYTALVMQQRAERTKQCTEEEDEALKHFADQHYYHFKKNTLIDPSGWVYAGVEDNRLAGVVATIFQKVGDEWIPWAAGEYDQENPLTTDSGGLFAWDVLTGVWKVLFQKEGYLDTWSDEMGVPPEWTKVAINMLRDTAPVGVSYNVADDYSYVDVTFDQYVVTDTMPIVTVNGVGVPGAVWLDVAMGKDADGNEVPMALVLRIPLASLATPGAVLNVSVSGAKSYTGKAMESPYAFQIAVPAAPPAKENDSTPPATADTKGAPAAASPATGDTLPLVPLTVAASALVTMMLSAFMLRRDTPRGKHSAR